MNFFLNLKDNANIILLYLFAICLPLGQKLSTYVLIAWVLSSLFLIKPSKVKANKSYLLLIALYFFYVLSLIYTEEFLSKYFEQKASLLVFPLLFYLNGYKYKKIVIDKTLYFFVIGCVISAIFCYGIALYNSINIIENSVVFIPELKSSLEFIESSIKGGNYFFGTHFSIFHHTTYFAMFLCFAIAIVLFKANLIINKYVSIFIVFLLSVVVLQISSRAGIATLFFIILYFLYNQFNKRIFSITSGIILLIIVSILLMLNPRVKNLASNIITKGVSFHNEDIDSASLRLMTWDASIQVIKKSPIIGVGIGDAYKALKQEYKKKRYVRPFRENFNAHNQYFQLAIECGIFTLMLFITQLISLFKKYRQNKIEHKAILIFLFIIAFNALFESVFNHYSGIVFYSFLFCVFNDNN